MWSYDLIRSQRDKQYIDIRHGATEPYIAYFVRDSRLSWESFLCAVSHPTCLSRDTLHRDNNEQHRRRNHASVIMEVMNAYISNLGAKFVRLNK